MKKTAPLSPEEADLLIGEVIDGGASPAQQAQLAHLLATDPAIRQTYLEHCRMEASLAWEFGVLGGEAFPTEPSPASRGEARIPALPVSWWKPLAWAASLMLVATTAGLFVPNLLREARWNAGGAVGIVDRYAGGSLAVSNTSIILSPGESLRAGEYELSGGFAGLTLAQNVSLMMEGPAHFQIVSAGRLILHRGKLAARVPPEGVGFTVETPHAQIVDHGTDFGVDVSADRTSEIHVFEGEVEVQSLAATTEPLRLVTAQATRVDAASGSLSGIELDQERFLRSFDEPSLPYSRKVKLKDPVAYYRMAISEDGLTLLDRSTHSHHGRIIRGDLDLPPMVPGRFGASLRTESKNFGWVSEGPTSESGLLTLTTWIYANTRVRSATIAHTQTPAGPGQFRLGLFGDQGGLAVEVLDLSGQVVRLNDPSPLPLGTWHHVAVVADGDFLALYRGGERVARTACTGVMPLTTQSLAIGAELRPDSAGPAPGTSRFWDGRIDEFAVLNAPLEPAEITALNQTTPPNRRNKK